MGAAEGSPGAGWQGGAPEEGVGTAALPLGSVRGPRSCWRLLRPRDSPCPQGRQRRPERPPEGVLVAAAVAVAVEAIRRLRPPRGATVSGVGAGLPEALF